jgi:integral membrane protein (TIGR01906 family)
MSDPVKPNSIYGFVRIAFITLMPFLLFLTSVRLTITPAYVRTAYAIPGFPEDSYGFTAEQRLRHAEIARQYLLNNAGIEFLGEQTFDNGSSLYNQRELSHMQDVKDLTGIVIMVWLALLTLEALAAVVLWRMKGQAGLGRSLQQAGKVTLVGMLGLGLALAISFPFVFVGFHRIFFEGNSWLFRYSDTLIRLFPERFWQQVFVFLTALTAGMALALRWLGKQIQPDPQGT